MQRVIVLALMGFLANCGVLYGILPAAIFADDPNPLLMLCCKVRPDGNTLPKAVRLAKHSCTMYFFFPPFSYRSLADF